MERMVIIKAELPAGKNLSYTDGADGADKGGWGLVGVARQGRLTNNAAVTMKAARGY